MHVIDALAALADPIRGRLLLALERHELAVGELASALQLPQSTVSRHLKTLGDAGWVTARSDGASRRYRLAGGREGAQRRLWAAVREPLAALPAATRDAQRLRAVLAERRTTTRAFFSSAAGRWDRVRAELFGARGDLVALLALLDDALVVGDLGCGTGAVADTLAPWVRRVVAVDASTPMLAEARRRLQEHANVELREGDLEALPVADGELDAALLVLALHHAPEPVEVLAEARRALVPGGRLVVVDLLPHEEEGYREAMGHVWLGFAPEQLSGWLADAGFEDPRVVPLPLDASARGPALFAASARRHRAPAPRAAAPSVTTVGSSAGSVHSAAAAAVSQLTP